VQFRVRTCKRMVQILYTIRIDLLRVQRRFGSFAAIDLLYCLLYDFSSIFVIENPFSNAQLHDEYLCQDSSKSLHYERKYLVTQSRT